MTEIIQYFIGALEMLFTYADSAWMQNPLLVQTFVILCATGGFIILIGLIAIIKTCITACANAVRGL